MGSGKSEEPGPKPVLLVCHQTRPTEPTECVCPWGSQAGCRHQSEGLEGGQPAHTPVPDTHTHTHAHTHGGVSPPEGDPPPLGRGGLLPIGTPSGTPEPQPPSLGEVPTSPAAGPGGKLRGAGEGMSLGGRADRQPATATGPRFCPGAPGCLCGRTTSSPPLCRAWSQGLLLSRLGPPLRQPASLVSLTPSGGGGGGERDATWANVEGFSLVFLCTLLMCPRAPRWGVQQVPVPRPQARSRMDALVPSHWDPGKRCRPVGRRPWM